MGDRMLAGLGLVASLGLAVAAPVRAQAAAPQEVTVSGTVVDLTCKFTKGVSGEAHRKCGEICASAGLPLAILGSDGKLYLPLGQDAGKPPVDLKAKVDQKVTVKGKLFTGNGATGIVITSVTS